MSRTGCPAGGSAPLGNGISSGDGLGIFFIDGFSCGQSFVIFIGQFYGTDLTAFPATSALGQIHKAGLLPESGLEMSCFSIQSENFGVGQNFDIQMPADLDQFGRDNSHGTIIGGKGLIQLRHQPADS